MVVMAKFGANKVIH